MPAKGGACLRHALIVALLRSTGMRLDRSARRRFVGQRLVSSGSFYARPGHANVVPPPASVDKAVDYSLPIRLEMLWPANESIIYGDAGFQLRIFNADHVTFEVLQMPQASRVRLKPCVLSWSRLLDALLTSHDCSSQSSNGGGPGPATTTSR